MSQRAPRNKWRNAEAPEELVNPPAPAPTPQPTGNPEYEDRIMRQATLVALAIIIAVAGLAAWLAKRL